MVTRKAKQEIRGMELSASLIGDLLERRGTGD